MFRHEESIETGYLQSFNLLMYCCRRSAVVEWTLHRNYEQRTSVRNEQSLWLLMSLTGVRHADKQTAKARNLITMVMLPCTKAIDRSRAERHFLYV